MVGAYGLGVLVWLGVGAGYAWAVWNLGRTARRPWPRDAADEWPVRIEMTGEVLEVTERQGDPRKGGRRRDCSVT